MEKKMMMPASYNVMSEEEMTYTQGGSLPYDIARWTFLALSAYVEYKTLPIAKKYVDQNMKKDLPSAAADSVTQFMNYISKDVKSAVTGVCVTWNLATWWPVTALYCMFA